MSDRVIVIGGGIAGMRSALDVAQRGARVTLVENKATIGGKLASILEEETNTLDLPEPADVASMDVVTKHPNIEILTFADVAGISGEAGRYSVTIRQRQRFVSDACDRCAQCRQVCPVVKPNEYDAGLSYRKAIFSPLRNAWPPIYAVDIATCLNEPPNYIPCNRCVQTCHVNAIRFDLPIEKTVTREAAAVVVAAGFDLADVGSLANYGYGSHPDVVTAMELERLFASSGVTGGFAARPSNEQDPASVLFVICDNNEFTWTYASRQISRLIDQAIENITVLYEQPPANGAAPESFLKGPSTHTVNLIHGKCKSIKPGDGAIRAGLGLNGATDSFKEIEMVVLATNVQPPAQIAALANILDIQLGADGYMIPDSRDGVGTSRPGIYVTGCVCGPKNIQATIAQSSAAAHAALKHVITTSPQPETAEAPAISTPSVPADFQARFQNAVITLMEMGKNASEKK